MTVCRVIVNQAHAIANGGSFDNGLPFSLTMGCGTWGRNNFSDNMGVRHYMNITRISHLIPERVPTGSRRKAEHSVVEAALALPLVLPPTVIGFYLLTAFVAELHGFESQARVFAMIFFVMMGVALGS